VVQGRAVHPAVDKRGERSLEEFQVKVPAYSPCPSRGELSEEPAECGGMTD